MIKPLNGQLFLRLHCPKSELDSLKVSEDGDTEQGDLDRTMGGLIDVHLNPEETGQDRQTDRPEYTALQTPAAIRARVEEESGGTCTVAAKNDPISVAR
jgi:hypothetical protein